jgi:hypothetical protein
VHFGKHTIGDGSVRHPTSGASNCPNLAAWAEFEADVGERVRRAGPKKRSAGFFSNSKIAYGNESSSESC